MERKIFNYVSEILSSETFDRFGYNPDQLGNTSSKFVIARCRYCGQSMEIRKGFFNKSGSACHKACRLKEQSEISSPFADNNIQQKAYKKRHAEKTEEERQIIAQHISDGRRKVQKQIEQTNQKHYGVINPFQSDSIKQKIKETNLIRYESEHPMQNQNILHKTQETLRERYGVDNLQQHDEFRQRAMAAFHETIAEDPDGKHKVLNTLRNETFWADIQAGKSLKEACQNHNIPYLQTSTQILKPEFKLRFQSVYHYPKTQKQNDVKNFLKFFDLDIIFNDRKVIKPLELDIYIPDKQFAIEFNGSLWHSEAMLSPQQARKKHWTKTQLCREKGIRLFHIFEHTWDTRQNQIMNFLLSSLGLNEQRIMARKCIISHVPCLEFLNANHIQKPPKNIIKYFNLEYGGEIVASMTASKHHRQINGNPIVLSRLCFSDNTTVQGGSTKLFKAFKKWASEEGFDRILSWSDQSWTDGNIYRVLGFQEQRSYGPDYFYWDQKKNEYVSKQSQRKSATGCPLDLTEREWCLQRKLFRIWDCGKVLWGYSLQEDLLKPCI